METFSELYVQYCGATEIPPEFNVWCALSLIAAAVGDRVYVETQRDDPIIPNLYVLLLGASGTGKGQAIKRVCRLVRDNATLCDATYYGKITGQGLADWMGGRTDGTSRINVGAGAQAAIPVPGKRHPYAYVVNEELALDIGRGSQADDFVKYLTGLYGGAPLPWRDRTRTGGEVTIDKACINWLAGTTQEWLIGSITRDAIEGGFFARTVIIEGREMPRRVSAVYPADYDELVGVLARLLGVLQGAEGRFVWTPLARAIESHWYMTRPRPTDSSQDAAWNRERVLLAKVCMLVALSEWAMAQALHEDGHTAAAPALVITDRHVLAAQVAIRRAHRATPRLLADATGRQGGKMVEYVRTQLVEHGTLDHSVLLTKCGGRGFTTLDLAAAIDMLAQQELVTVGYVETSPGHRKKQYVWSGRVRVPASAMTAGGAADLVDGDE